MFKFEYQCTADSPRIVVEIHPDSDLGECVEAFESFLKAAGYPLNNQHLEIVEDIDEYVQ